MSNANEKHNYKGGSKMAVLAKPNEHSYIIEKKFMNEFIGSKNSKAENSNIKEKANVFRQNNLNSKKNYSED